MNNLKNLTLLYEVRKDVFEKIRDAEYGERLFSMMHHMDQLLRITRKEGLLALEDAAKEIPAAQSGRASDKYRSHSGARFSPSVYGRP